MKRATMWVLAVAIAAPAAGVRAQELDPADFALTAIADSTEYLVYTYALTNPSSSSWSVAALRLDVSASSGTPEALPATGEFLNPTAWTGALEPLHPYAQVGPIAPGSWWTVLQRTGMVKWYAPTQGPVATDSVGPGSTLAGFGLRSTYLPAVREVRAEPTWQSCCTVPRPVTDENPSASEFAARSYAVAPGYMPGEITIALVQSQVTKICTDPLWLGAAELCAELSGLLASAARSSDAGGDTGEAVTELRRVRARVEEERDRMRPDAYWLLRYNVRQASENVRPR